MHLASPYVSEVATLRLSLNSAELASELSASGVLEHGVEAGPLVCRSGTVCPHPQVLSCHLTIAKINPHGTGTVVT